MLTLKSYPEEEEKVAHPTIPRTMASSKLLLG